MLQFLAQRPVANDLATELDAALAQLFAGFDQVFEAFERHQPPDAENLNRPVGDWFRAGLEKVRQVHPVIDPVDFARRIRTPRLHQVAAVFRFHRHEFRFVADFAEQIVVPKIGHEILAVRGYAERKTGHRLQEQGGVRGAIGEMDMKMIDRVPAEKLGEITRVPRPRRRLHHRAVFPFVRFDQRLRPAVLLAFSSHNRTIGGGGA